MSKIEEPRRTAYTYTFTAPPSAPAPPLPVVYDPQCPRDYAHEFRGMLVVGDKSKATHEVVAIVAPRGEFVRFEFRSLAAPPAPKITGGAVWTGAKAEEMIASGRPILPESWSPLAGVPAPDYMWGSMRPEPEPLETSAAVGLYPGAMERAREVMGRWDPSAAAAESAMARECDCGGRCYGCARAARHRDKHGPGGFGGAGPCDADCRKCAGEAAEAKKLAASRRRHFMQAQRGDGGLMAVLSPEERQRASAEWSAQLRAKVEDQRERDAEAARVTPYWSPEEQSGDDL